MAKKNLMYCTEFAANLISEAKCRNYKYFAESIPPRDDAYDKLMAMFKERNAGEESNEQFMVEHAVQVALIEV